MRPIPPRICSGRPRRRRPAAISYHADWEKVREHRKAHRLAKLVGALPRIRRHVSLHLSGDLRPRLALRGDRIDRRTGFRPGTNPT